MHDTANPDRLMDHLLEIAAYVGTRPMQHEKPQDFVRRILIDIDDRIEFLDDELRFRALALISPRHSR